MQTLSLQQLRRIEAELVRDAAGSPAHSVIVAEVLAQLIHVRMWIERKSQPVMPDWMLSHL